MNDRDTDSDGSATTLKAATTLVSEDSSTGVQLPPAGYDLGDIIGRGGMGEVVAAHDLRIGRDVAIKRMHDNPSPVAISRFLREARIQARLDHPAIVPVHELGTDAAGRPFFTMKRLTGVTLAESLTETGPTQPLLRAFVEVCLAIELAHARGVVHRDLKPANIMLGDYGEVYVIDWGVARVLDERPLPAEHDVEPGEPGNMSDVSGATKAGAVLGTPGYMPPEQVRGDEVGTPADVYALGAILFEILTREPLHPRGKEALVSTLTSGPQSPARRAPDRNIAPELEDACRATLADEPAERPTVRELADRLRSYIDGDRDHERRRALAAEHVASATSALATDRATALRHAGRALALDPESPEAAGLVTRLLVERPAELPAGLVEDLAQLDREALKTRQRRATFSYGMVFLFLLFIPFLEIRSWPWLIAFYAVLGALVAFAWRGTRTGDVSPYLSMLGNFALALVWTRIASPFVLTPVMICGALIAVCSHPWNQQRPWTIFAWAIVTVLTPFGLESFGVLDSTWKIGDGMLMISSQIYEITGWKEAAAVVVANLVFILLVGAFALTIARRARNAQRDLHIQAWHLRHLMPEVPAR